MENPEENLKSALQVFEDTCNLMYDAQKSVMNLLEVYEEYCEQNDLELNNELYEKAIAILAKADELNELLNNIEEFE